MKRGAWECLFSKKALPRKISPQKTETVSERKPFLWVVRKKYRTFRCLCKPVANSPDSPRRTRSGKVHRRQSLTDCHLTKILYPRSSRLSIGIPRVFPFAAKLHAFVTVRVFERTAQTLPHTIAAPVRLSLVRPPQSAEDARTGDRIRGDCVQNRQDSLWAVSRIFGRVAGNI